MYDTYMNITYEKDYYQNQIIGTYLFFIFLFFFIIFTICCSRKK